MARLARRAGQPELAAEAWGRVAALSPDDALPLISQARALIQMKDYAGAVMAGRGAITRDSGNVESFQVTGIAQLSMNELAPFRCLCFRHRNPTCSSHWYRCR